MTLHEAIEMILQNAGRPMTSIEIANIINEEKLYSKRDGKPVSSSQVAARVNNYKTIFAIDSGKVSLLKNDLVSIAIQKYRNEFSHALKTSNFHNVGGRIKTLIDALQDLKPQSDFERELDDYNENDDLDIFNVSEPLSQYGLVNNNDNLKIAFGLSNWILKQDSNFKLIFTEKFVSILSGLHWFKKGNQNLITDVQDSNHFVLKIVADNPQATFKVEREKSDSDNEYDKYFANQLNHHVEDLINMNSEDLYSSSNALRTKIICPSFNSNSHLLSHYDAVLKELEFSKPRFEKAILILPASSLNSLQTKDVYARERIVESGFLDSVVLFSKKMVENTDVAISALILDFKKQNNEVFFFDCSDIFKSDTKIISDIINRKTQIQDIAKSVNKRETYYHVHSLFPREFVFDPNNIEVKDGYQLYSLNDLIIDKKSGVRLKNRDSLYSGGEYKLIRTTDIRKNNLYFQSKENMVGIDHEELLDKEKSLISGGVVVSGFNEELNASVIDDEETYALGQDVYWLKINNKKIIDEYLVKEFSEEYVTKQVRFYSKGSPISRLYLKDLLKIKIQVPSSEIQKELIYQELKNENKYSPSNDVSEKELDFIKTLKHTLIQPTASLANDFTSLKTFIKNKIISKELLYSEETIVPIFPSEAPEEVSRYKISNTLDRMDRALTDMDYILEQAVKVIEITKPINKENIKLKTFLQDFISEYLNITIKVVGREVEILADKKQLRILFHNFINNAIKHGFDTKVENPTIWLEIKSKDKFSVHLSIRNNGRPLPQQFSIKDFLAKGASSDIDVGSGFGGFLIGRILENHKGEILLTKKEDFGALAHNVEFLIILPK